ncbi:MAG: hypothetical protein JW818_00300 [Pirellulales bacterium]|nr:hypothetical protein [Pirellulales bacterium]
MKYSAILIMPVPLMVLAGCWQNAEEVPRQEASQRNITRPTPKNAVTSQQEAIEAIEKLGGHVYPSVDGIGFDDTTISDAALEHVKWFPRLKELTLNDTHISDAALEHLVGLNHLEQLNLYGTRVTGTGLRHLKGHKHLRYLNLNNTKATDTALENLEGMSALEDLGLMNTQVTDAGLKHLSQLTHLTDLDLSGTKVTDAGLVWLSKLRQLNYLSIEDTEITDAGLEHLKGLTKLERVFLDKTRVTDEGVKMLKQILPNWVVISDGKGFLSDWKKGMPIPMCVTPYYNFEGPQINVGAFSKPLSGANAETIKDVVADMKKQWDTLPIEAMYVAAIRLYDLGRKDEAVYWFHAANQRARLFLDVAKTNEIGSAEWEASQAFGAFHQLAGQWINGYAAGNLDALKTITTTVQSDSVKSVPKFAKIYPALGFIPDKSWVEKNRKAAAYFVELRDYIEKNADEIKAQRKQQGLEGKY